MTSTLYSLLTQLKPRNEQLKATEAKGSRVSFLIRAALANYGNMEFILATKNFLKGGFRLFCRPILFSRNYFLPNKDSQFYKNF